MDEQGVERESAPTSQPAKQEEGTPITLRSQVILTVGIIFLWPVAALYLAMQGETGWMNFLLISYIPMVIMSVGSCFVVDKDNVIMRTVTSGFESEEDKQRRHEIALAEVKNRGVIEPHRLKADTERYKADKDTEVSLKKIEIDLRKAINDFAAVGINASKERDLKQLDVDGKIIEMKTKLEATPQETRISKAQEQLVAIEKIQAVRVAADAFKMRDDDGKIIYVGGKPTFENSDDQAAYEAQMETYKRLLKQIAG